MTPSTYRNVSSFIIAINKENYVLMDCGEGTTNQLYEQFGDKTEEVISKIKFVYLSHIHGDHILGIYRFIE